MNNPPIFPLPSGWHALLVGLTWGVVTGSLGRFTNASSANVYMAGVEGSSSTPVWAISTTAPSSGVAEVLFTSATASILQNGTVNANGTITNGGASYAIQLYFDGTNMTAHAKSLG